MLLKNPSLLLRRGSKGPGRSCKSEKRPVLTLTADDNSYLPARLAAVLNDQQSVVTTAEEWIPEPPVGGDRQVRLMDDLRYGSDEYTMWPQPFHRDLPHLPYIRTTRTGHGEEFLFADVAEEAFVVTQTEGYGGLGFIANRMIEDFVSFMARCGAREQVLGNEEQVVFQSAKQSEIYYSGKADIQSFIWRLRCLPSTFLTTQRTIRHLQRGLLEWDAWLRYWEVFRPRTQEVYSRRVQSDVTAIGAFVYRTEHAELLQRARVPFWLIRPYEYVLNIEVEEIGHLVPATDMELSSVCHPRDHRVIFTGAATDIRRYEAIRAAGRALLSFPDPFSSVVAPSPLTSQARSSSSGGQIRALNKQEKRRLTASPCKLQTDRKVSLTYSNRCSAVSQAKKPRQS